MYAIRSYYEWREEFMDPVDDGMEGMTFGADAIDRGLVANEAGTRGKTERIPVDLTSVRRVDIEVDQARRRMAGLQMDAGFLHRLWVCLQAEDCIRPQDVVKPARFGDAGQYRRLV